MTTKDMLELSEVSFCPYIWVRGTFALAFASVVLEAALSKVPQVGIVLGKVGWR